MQNDKAKFKKEFKERVYRFILRLIEFIDGLPKDGCSKLIGDQLLRSGTSIGANYIESLASSSKKDFTNFFTHSLKSANESKFWLALLRDTGRAKAEDCQRLLQGLSEIANILATSILTLKGRRQS